MVKDRVRVINHHKFMRDRARAHMARGWRAGGR